MAGDALVLALSPLGLAHRIEHDGPAATLAGCIGLIEAAAALASAQGVEAIEQRPEGALWVLPADDVQRAITLGADLCALALDRRADSGGPLPGVGLACGALVSGSYGAFGLPALRARALAGVHNRGAELLAADAPSGLWGRPPPGIGAQPLRADRCAAIGFPVVLLRDHREG